MQPCYFRKQEAEADTSKNQHPVHDLNTEALDLNRLLSRDSSSNQG